MSFQIALELYVKYNNNNNNTLYFHWVTGFTQSNFRPGPTF
jgi:hypothetical protein